MIEMHLHNEPFELIKNGTKTVEIRLFDEKRKTLKVGDTILFINRINQEQLLALIIGIKLFNTFEELYQNYNQTQLGYSEKEVANPKDMEQYYSLEEQKKDGVVAIEFNVIK